MSQQPYTPPTERDITMDAIQVCKTLLLLDKPYSAGYINRVLRADEAYGFRKEGHKQIETFGLMEEETFGYVDDLIHYLVRAGFLRINNPRYGTIELSEKGEAFMEKPEELVVPLADLRKSWYELELIIRLKQLRKELAEETEKAPYEIFNNYLLQRMAHEMPDQDVTLKAIPGLEDLKAATRLRILAEVSRVAEMRKLDEKTGVYSRASSRSHRVVQSLFEAGFGPEEIARRRDIQEATVHNYLETLHRAGRLDLRPWIEERLGSKDLHRGLEYFKSVETPKLQEAHQLLGMEYDALKLCQLYLAEVHEADVAYATAPAA